MTRPDWNQYFMALVDQAASRATCPRKRVGAVIVRDRSVLATGYNGSIRGLPHCEDVGCDMAGDHCVRTVHAEVNALLQAARLGVSVEAASLYTTALPCWQCFKAVVNAGLYALYIREPAYRPGSDERVFRALADLKYIEVYCVPESGPTKTLFRLSP